MKEEYEFYCLALYGKILRSWKQSFPAILKLVVYFYPANLLPTFSEIFPPIFSPKNHMIWWPLSLEAFLSLAA